MREKNLRDLLICERIKPQKSQRFLKHKNLKRPALKTGRAHQFLKIVDFFNENIKLQP